MYEPRPYSSAMHFGLIQPDTNFYFWFGTSIYRENHLQCIPPYSMALVLTLKVSLNFDNI